MMPSYDEKAILNNTTVRQYHKKGSMFTQDLDLSYYFVGKPTKCAGNTNHKKTYGIQGLDFLYSVLYRVSYHTAAQ